MRHLHLHIIGMRVRMVVEVLFIYFKVPPITFIVQFQLYMQMVQQIYITQLMYIYHQMRSLQIY